MIHQTSLRQFLQEKVKFLNECARSIDPSLFFFCNYDPLPLPSFTFYDCFLLAIQELYKFAIDCCPLHSVFLNSCSGSKNACADPLSRQLSYLPEESRTQYSQIYRRIQILRTVYDHNLSKSNSALQHRNLNEFCNAFVYTTGFEYDANDLSSKDFEPAYSKLMDDAENLAGFITSFAQQIKILPPQQKDSVVKAWREKILAWYSRSAARRDIFRGHFPSQPSFKEFQNFMVKASGQYIRLPDHMRKIIRGNQGLIDRLGKEDEKEEALSDYKRNYENGAELSDEQSAKTPEIAKARLEHVNEVLQRIIDALGQKNYGKILLDYNCQTAFFEAAQTLYPTCSLLPQEFYDYVVYKLLML